MTRERREEDGKTHRPIVPAGWQPKSRPLICRSNIREALGWLVGWLAGGKEVPSVRRTPNQSGVRERYEKDELGWDRVSGWVDGEANDTSLGNFNFAEITVEANKNKEISAKRSLSLCVSLSVSFILPLHHILLPSRARYIVSHHRHYTTVSTIHVPNRVYFWLSFFWFCVFPSFFRLFFSF